MSWTRIMSETTKKDVKDGWRRYKKCNSDKRKV